MRCAIASPGAMQPGGTCPYILLDYTGTGEERMEKIKRKKDKKGKETITRHQRNKREKEIEKKP